MLSDPNKKVLILGLHPEISTEETRIIEPTLEDPIYVND
jgi:hypothetical protein